MEVEEVAAVEYDKGIGYFAYLEGEIGNMETMESGIQISAGQYSKFIEMGVPTLDAWHIGVRKPAHLKAAAKPAARQEMPGESGVKTCAVCGESFVPSKFTPYQKKCQSCKSKKIKK